MNQKALDECIKLCWNARHSCQEVLFRHCLPIGGPHLEEAHVRLMADCIQLCQATADFMTRGSAMYEIICAACADICKACATACETIGDERMMRCAEDCRACARSCRALSSDLRAAA